MTGQITFSDTPSVTNIKEPAIEGIELNDGKTVRFVEFDANLGIFRVGSKDRTNTQYVRFTAQEWHRMAEYFRTVGVNSG